MIRNKLLLFLWMFCIGCALFSCDSFASIKKPVKIAAKQRKKTKHQSDEADKNTPHALTAKVRMDLDSLIRVSIPNFGYRFQMEGDFNGDGKMEILTEHYVSQVTGEEMNKYFDGIDDFATEVELAVYRKPLSLLLSSDPAIATFRISDDPQLFGLKFLKNEGDLDGDGADELSYCISWADWSSVNQWYIASYKNGKWVTLYSFEMRDWQTPYLPDYYDKEGTFLSSNKVMIPAEDTANTRMERELLDFQGLVKKTGKRKIEVQSVTFQSEALKKVVILK